MIGLGSDKNRNLDKPVCWEGGGVSYGDGRAFPTSCRQQKEQAERKGRREETEKGVIFFLLWYVQSYIEKAQIKMGQESMVKI